MWSKLKALFTKKQPIEIPDNHLIIYHVHDGPMGIEDLPEDEVIPDGAEFALLCKVGIEGEVFDDLVWFNNMHDALHIKDQFKHSIAPIVLEL